MALYRRWLLRGFDNPPDNHQKPDPKLAAETEPDPEEIDQEAALFHFLGSGKPLPVNKDGKRILRDGQQILYMVLRACEMPERQVLRILRHTDYVPCLVLDVVAEDIEDNFCADVQPTLTDVARRCVAAGAMFTKVRRLVRPRK